MDNDLIKYTSALLKGLMLNSQDYRGKIETAKTSTKKEYYKKKLKKNNLKLMEVLTTMERLSRLQDKKDLEDNNENETDAEISQDEDKSG